MPPTIQDGQKNRDQDRRQSSLRQTVSKADFVSRVKYNNNLPDIPFDAKFIAYPFESNRFVDYKPTTLEKNYKHEMLTEVDLGVNIDLIDPDTYAIDHNVSLDHDDEKLLEEEPVNLPDKKRTAHHNKNVSWLRRTEYISTEYNRSRTSNEMVETKVGFNVKKKFQGTDIYKDRESQIAAIESTFDAAQRPILRHPTKPGVTPLEVLPVFPDFQMWAQPCAHVIFDTDPTPRGRGGPAEDEEMSQAMIRGMVDASGDQFVAYFLPSKETIRKRKRDQEGETEYTEEEEYEYKMAREYNWNVKNKATKGYEENYFFVFREGEGVFYDELVTRVHLSKRRARGGAGGVQSAVSQLVVKHRELNENEKKAQQMRRNQLDTALAEEEDEEEGDEDDEGEEAAENEEEDNQDNDIDDEDDDVKEDDNEAEQESNDEKDEKDEKESSEEEASSQEESNSEEEEDDVE
ncbi:RNA polymerase II-associated factor 1 homolog [Stylophora pistillata]|uniref:RNA polymerase II-associated factor 1 homolog n=1 Tax=Stylophora pistillata TaxID=50429 RepID=A0A2B4SF27_STYPI|nr:RNA polymerase II-associated factor 1 homolog [Stylophora pistillata]PFX27167.1 RNA polymerase II-associated factor 1-like [Stylophora pistillata]